MIAILLNSKHSQGEFTFESWRDEDGSVALRVTDQTRGEKMQADFYLNENDINDLMFFLEHVRSQRAGQIFEEVRK